MFLTHDHTNHSREMNESRKVVRICLLEISLPCEVWWPPVLNPSTQDAEAVDFYEFKDSLIYIASSRSAKVK